MLRHIFKVVAVLAICAIGSAHAADLEDPLKTYRGSVTYVDFWASWCAPCADSFIWLNAMQSKYAGQGLRIVGVNLDSQTAKADRFLEQHPAAFPIVRDPIGRLAQQYAVEGMPFAVILDADGKVVSQHVGYRREESLQYEKAIQAALAAKEARK